jgi:hypothetical protein
VGDFFELGVDCIGHKFVNKVFRAFVGGVCSQFSENSLGMTLISVVFMHELSLTWFCLALMTAKMKICNTTSSGVLISLMISKKVCLFLNMSAIFSLASSKLNKEVKQELSWILSI